MNDVRGYAAVKYLLFVAAVGAYCFSRVRVFQGSVASMGTKNGTAPTTAAAAATVRPSSELADNIRRSMDDRAANKRQWETDKPPSKRKRAGQRDKLQMSNSTLLNLNGTLPNGKRPYESLLFLQKKLERGERAKRRDNLQPSNITIHLFDSRGSVRSIDYTFLTAAWDRGTTYEDLLSESKKSVATQSTTSATEELQAKLKNSNITIIFHNSPKTASSTLRKACLETQYDSCHLPRKPESNKWPEGYRTPKRLVQLFGECPDTRHFCVKERVPLMRGYASFYDTRSFLHMFPFRNYDEWSKSALHQISYRDGEEGCQRVDQYLDECCTECMARSWELKLERYGKAILAEIVESFERLRAMYGNRQFEQKVNGHHHFLMHNYLDLDTSLKWLHDACGVPLLPGTEEKVNSVRPPGSCKDEEVLMEKFHGCFDDHLAKLH